MFYEDLVSMDLSEGNTIKIINENEKKEVKLIEVSDLGIWYEEEGYAKFQFYEESLKIEG